MISLNYNLIAGLGEFSANFYGLALYVTHSQRNFLLFGGRVSACLSAVSRLSRTDADGLQCSRGAGRSIAISYRITDLKKICLECLEKIR